MDRAAIERHQQVGEQAAADAHQGRQQSDEEAVEPHQRSLRDVVAEFPVVARQQQPRGGRPCHADEDDLEQPLRRVTRGDAAGDDADHDRQPPRLEDFQIDRAAGVMGAKRTDRGRDDDGERSADAERHPHLQRHAGEPEAFVEHRHQDRAAADPENAGEKPRHRADRDQHQRQFDKLDEIESGHHHPACALRNDASVTRQIAGATIAALAAAPAINASLGEGSSRGRASPGRYWIRISGRLWVNSLDALRERPRSGRRLLRDHRAAGRATADPLCAQAVRRFSTTIEQRFILSTGRCKRGIPSR